MKSLIFFAESRPSDAAGPGENNNPNLPTKKMYIGPPLSVNSYPLRRRPNNEGFEIILRKNPVTGLPEYRNILERITFRTLQRLPQESAPQGSPHNH